MKLEFILSKCDHTLLAPNSSWEQIKEICDDGIKYSTASVCIPLSFVERAKEYVGNKLPICTVNGFPTGYSTTEVKRWETSDAVKNGADEIDIVINIGSLKDGDSDHVLNEISEIKKGCNG